MFTHIICVVFFPGNMEVRAGLRTTRQKRGHFCGSGSIFEMVCCASNMTLQWCNTLLSYLDHKQRHILNEQRSSQWLGSPGLVLSGLVIFGVLDFWDYTRSSLRVSFAMERNSQILSILYSEQAQRPLSFASLFSDSHQMELLQSSGPQKARCSALTCSLAAAEGCGCGCLSYCSHWGDHTPTRGMPQVAEKIIWGKRRVASFIGQTHSYATLTVRFQIFHTSEGHLKKNGIACIIVTGKSRVWAMFRCYSEMKVYAESYGETVADTAVEGSHCHAPSTASTSTSTSTSIPLFCWVPGVLVLVFITVEQGR